MIESEKFMRLDKFLCENNIGTRSQVKDAIRKGMVTIFPRLSIPTAGNRKKK